MQVLLVFLLEACVPLLLMIFIVWWTLGTSKKPAPAEQEQSLPSSDNTAD